VVYIKNKNIELLQLMRRRQKLMKSVLTYMYAMVIILIFFLTQTIAFAATQGTHNYAIFEITLTATGNYSNPYLQMPGDSTSPGFVVANFNGPNGETVTIDGFWDGGNTWKIRMAPTAVGTWTYTTFSPDNGLNGKSGSFNSIPSARQGFVELDPNNQWGWRTSGDLKPHFWMGDTCWRCFQVLTIAQFQGYINARASQGFNHIRGHFNSMDSGVSNEGGPPFSNGNWDTINPGYWQGVDTRLSYANSKGITMDLTIGSGNRWPNITAKQRDRYIRYLIARYAAYNLTWEGLSEYEENSNGTILINAIGNMIKNKDPYNHPRSTHTLDSNAELVTSGWLNWIMYQSNGPNPSTIISDRRYGKPLINEEYYYEQTCSGSSAHNSTPDQLRTGAWEIAVSGGYFATGNTATYTGGSNSYNSCGLTGTGVSQMKHLYNFWTGNNIPYWQMEPQNSLATNGARCLAKVGETYICYKENGGSFTLDLTRTTGTFFLKRFNPRDGSFTALPDVSGGTAPTITLPDNGDWVFLVQFNTPSDTTPPTITSVSATHTQVEVVFSEPVEQASATNKNNYQINNGITISSASLGTDLKTVTLTTSQHTEGITYTLTVNSIKDRATPPNTIASNTQKTYTLDTIPPAPPTNLTIVQSY